MEPARAGAGSPPRPCYAALAIDVLRRISSNGIRRPDCCPQRPRGHNTPAAAGLEASRSRPANPYDKAAVESFNATCRRECVGLAKAAGGYATADLFRPTETYHNRVRRHGAPGYRALVDFELQLN